MKALRLSHLHFVLATGFLFIFAKFWEPGLGLSSTSYGAIADSMLQSGHFFHPKMGKDLMDPFVDHPYLGIWLDDLVFWLFGASAQTVRLVSSIMGLVVMGSVFKISDTRFGSRAAFLSVVGLFIVNMYMNFNSSGWLDMPMIGFIWLGFALLFFEDRTSKGDPLLAFCGGLSLACAFLIKGIGALPILPILGWYAIRSWPHPTISDDGAPESGHGALASVKDARGSRPRWASLMMVAVGAVLPLVIFTWAHYQNEGFFFWTAYLKRQFGTLNQSSEAVWWDHLWYPKEILRIGHVVAVVGLIGIYQACSRKSTHRDLGFLALAVVVLHFVAYSFSARHYDQYIVPLIPWFALLGAFYAQSFFKFNAEIAGRYLFYFAILYFVVVDLVPIRVHSSSGEAYRSFTQDLDRLADDRKVFILGVREDQDTWEDVASFVAWYWRREPELVDFSVMLRKLSAESSLSSGVVEQIYLNDKTRAVWAQYPNVKVCLENSNIMLLTNEALCSESYRRQRSINPSAQIFRR